MNEETKTTGEAAAGATSQAVKSQVAENEELILKSWQDNKIFEKTLAQNEGGEEFVFYDGPPFATGTPHYGHILPGTMKDMIPRYKTMRGFYVSRQWGWDCHGLPVENLVEKELGLKNKKDIETYGIEKFNLAARNIVMRYADDWLRIIPRTGRFVDMKNDYKTMDTGYTESVWWAFSELFKKQLAYEGYKIMPYCPRCGTTLSNFEVNQGYKDITDISVYAKFKLKDQPDTFFVAWTTTPWTLPGNVALAVNPKVDYVKIKMGDVFYILAKPRLAVVKDPYEIVEEFKGETLVGKSYEPIFDYYVNAKLENKENAWKVYGGDFVTTEDGSGIVHIAPAFGTDDYELAQREKLPVIIHVNKDGVFKDEVTDFKGQYAKPKEDPQKGDVEIIKNLAPRGLLFAKEKIVHSYAHCWRCETPLLNYASSSWFVKVTDIKDKLVNENQKVNWVPEHIKDGRFGKWLEGARDWAVSRSRYWGASIPVWKCDTCEHMRVVSSTAELVAETKSVNNYFLVRHGEAESNVRNIINSNLDNNTFALSEKGKAQAAAATSVLKHKKIDIVYTSPFLRTQQTTQIIYEKLGIDPSHVFTDKRLSEVNAGSFDGKSVDEFHEYFLENLDRFAVAPAGGENYLEVRKRMMSFMYDIDAKHAGKNILIVTHDTPLWLLCTGTKGMTAKQALEHRGKTKFYQPNAEVRELSFSHLPHNENFELDLHRPYIDGVTFACVCGKGTMHRIPEVFDTWFDSGAMVFARHHYKGEATADFDPKSGLLHKSRGFPADFIAEGQDQTRGWFYTLIVLSTALFGKVPYKNVIVSGLVLAEDGRKMSKSLKNYPEITYILDKYGADALRYYLMSSPLVHAEDVNFSEKSVDEIYKKSILRLGNVVSFYEMFTDHKNVDGLTKDTSAAPTVQHSKNVLDRWIIARLNQVIAETTEGLEKYELDRAVRPFESFIDDLSTWYLRRSRDRFKSEDVTDKEAALFTLRHVLVEFSKVIAPVMPFIADDIYLKMKAGLAKLGKESVHLETWPKGGAVDAELIEQMKKVRDIVTLALEARSKAGMKVRQPLARLSIKKQEGKNKPLTAEMLDLIKDEVNVKEVTEDLDPKNAEQVTLDTTLTDDLKLEGNYRELLRGMQELRKKKNLQASDRIVVNLETTTAGVELVRKFSGELKRIAGITEINFVPVFQGDLLTAGDITFKVDILV